MQVAEKLDWLSPASRNMLINICECVWPPAQPGSIKQPKSRYLAFCSRFSLPPLPASEQTLIPFAAELVQDLAHSTIRSYLSGMRNSDVTNGMADPLPGVLRLNLVLKDIQRVEATPPKVELLVTPLVLHRLRRVLLAELVDPDGAMLWAACCVRFMAFSAAVPNGKFDPSVYLATQDVAVDSHTSPSWYGSRFWRLTSSSMEPPYLWLPITMSCAYIVAAVLSYSVSRPPNKGPLFQFADGSTNQTEVCEWVPLGPFSHRGASCGVYRALISYWWGHNSSSQKDLWQNWPEETRKLGNQGNQRS